VVIWPDDSQSSRFGKRCGERQRAPQRQVVFPLSRENFTAPRSADSLVRRFVCLTDTQRPAGRGRENRLMGDLGSLPSSANPNRREPPPAGCWWHARHIPFWHFIPPINFPPIVSPAKTQGDPMKNSARHRTTTPHLTPREHDVFKRLSRGRLNKEIADELGIAIQTVKNHLHLGFQKLKVANRVEAVTLYTRLFGRNHDGKPDKDRQAVPRLISFGLPPLGRPKACNPCAGWARLRRARTCW